MSWFRILNLDSRDIEDHDEKEDSFLVWSACVLKTEQ